MAFAPSLRPKAGTDWSAAAQCAALVLGEVTWTYLLSPSPGSPTAPARNAGAVRAAGAAADGGIAAGTGFPSFAYPTLRMMDRRRTTSTSSPDPHPPADD